MKQQTTPTTDQKEYLEPKGFKGTPGKWDIFESNVGVYITSNENDIAEVDLRHRQAEPKSNAKLISQSKELAKALQDIKDHVELNKAHEIDRAWIIGTINKNLKEAGL